MNSTVEEGLQPIESKIHEIRGVQVILDTDIAVLYGIATKRLNEQVKRNASRFPSDFMFQLTKDELYSLRSHFATANWSKRRSLPYAFTELGVSMLSSVLTSEVAIQTNVRIMRVFASMRRFLVPNIEPFSRWPPRFSNSCSIRRKLLNSRLRRKSNTNTT